MNPILVAVCVVGIQSGDFNCYDTAFESPAYIDCVDDPSTSPLGASERGSGFIRWGDYIGGEFVENGHALYEWSGVQAQPGGVSFLLVGVDEDRVFGDGLERECRAGMF